MIRETLLWISETLFYLTGGIPLLNTIWFIPWVIIGSVIMAFPLLYPLCFRQRLLKFGRLIFIIAFWPVMTIVISPGVIQGQLKHECKTIEGEVFANAYMNGEKIEPQPVTIRQCRYKENYYEEFGEWKIRGVTQK